MTGKIKKYVHKDLSWLDFNARVIAEAGDENLPLYERIKFLAIYSSNLDEFFRIKVAGLKKLANLKKAKVIKWLDFNPVDILLQIKTIVHEQQEYFGKIWKNGIMPGLVQNNIIVYQDKNIIPQHKEEIFDYFRTKIIPYLHVITAAKTNKVKVDLLNHGIYLVVPLISKQTEEKRIGYVRIPSPPLPRFFELSSIDSKHYIIWLDDILKLYLDLIFPEYIPGNSYSIKLNLDEDYEIEDEFSGDIVEKVKEQLEKRKNNDPVRLLYDGLMPQSILEEVMADCCVTKSELVVGGTYHNMSDLFKLPNPAGGLLKEEKLPALPHVELDNYTNIYTAMQEKDFLLQFPYHKYDYVLRFFNEAVIDPQVKEIKVTLYRITSSSLIANALISAAKNGKKVTVLVEIKARYDEFNNIYWAQEMENAGVKIIYNLPGLKVHSKITLITKEDAAGNKTRLAYLSTGNFNEQTAEIYADYGLLTTQNEITNEIEDLFNFFKNRYTNKKFKHLLVAGFNMKEKLLKLIDNEIKAAKKGLPAGIIIKVNGLDEKEMIEKLYEASTAGVNIQLIVRAGCSLIPGHADFSKNIKAYRLVDRYLEHARVYFFLNNGKEKLYLSSADWMNRNLNRRIEVGFPVYDNTIKDQLKQVLQLQLNDTVKLTSIGDFQSKVTAATENGIRAQMEIYNKLKNNITNY